MKMKIKIIIIIAAIIFAGIISGIIVLGMRTNDNSSTLTSQSSIGDFILNTSFPNSPATAPKYKIVSTDRISLGSEKSLSIKKNIPSVEDAPVLAEKILESYGGLPKDAVLYRVEQVSTKKYDLKTGIIEEEYPQMTQVGYEQRLAGLPVYGAGARLNVGLGENGEMVHLIKTWRTVEYAGDIPIISAEDAYEKLKKGELVTVQGPIADLKISDIKLGYYAQYRDSQNYYTPVWLFYAAKEGQTPFPYLVDAVKTS